MRQTRGLVALRAYAHNFGSADITFSFDDTAGFTLSAGLLMTGNHVYSLNQDHTCGRIGRKNLALLTDIFTGQNNNGVIFSNMQFH
jgi:hypothetical protein